MYAIAGQPFICITLFFHEKDFRKKFSPFSLHIGITACPTQILCIFGTKYQSVYRINRESILGVFRHIKV